MKKKDKELRDSLERNFRDEFTQIELENVSRDIDYKNH